MQVIYSAVYIKVRAKELRTMKLLISIIFLLHITSCTSQNSESSIVGIWKTQPCVEHSELSGLWLKATYQFTAEGSITFLSNGFTDADCVTPINPDHYIYGYAYSATYTTLTSGFTPEGLNGTGIEIEIAGWTSENIRATGYFTINNEQLCFSNVFTFNSEGYSINTEENDNINFETCLVKTKPL